MAGRNVASMHLFLEMKKRFPDVHEDILRNYVFLYAEDEAKCISLLQQESKNHFHASQLFTDATLFKRKVSYDNQSNGTTFQSVTELNDTLKFPQSNANLTPTTIKTSPSSAPVTPNSEKPVIESYSTDPTSSRQTNDYRMVFSTTKEFPQSNANLTPTTTKMSSNSAPGTPNSEKPVIESFSTDPTSSRQTNDYRMVFSTTKEHTIPPTKQQHAVSLNITPSFPFAHQLLNVYSSAVTAATSQASKPGRHTTSLNLQLQDPYPVEIVTVPTGSTNPSDYADFGSHLRISVGSQGTTFTALRLQRPIDVSSQKNSKDSVAKSTSTSSLEKNNNDKDQSLQNHFSPAMNFNHGFQASTDYLQAVKKHQLSQMNLVSAELNKEKAISSDLKKEIHKIEQQLNFYNELSHSYTSPEVLMNLSEENQKLRRECDNLLMEIDLCSKGQIPLGVTDEDFYENIFTGPNDGLFLVSDESDAVNGDKSRTLSEEEDERNCWKCQKCTFENHPALEKCEICELERDSDFFFDNARI